MIMYTAAGPAELRGQSKIVAIVVDDEIRGDFTLTPSIKNKHPEAA